MARTEHYRSKDLPRHKVVEAIAAYRFAEAAGHELNLTLDIHWEWTRFANNNRRKAVAALLESQRKWLNHRDVSFYSILVRENPPPANQGEHAHQLVHVPPGLQPAFAQHTRDFIRGNKRHQKKALAWDEPYNDGKLAYMLKGCTPPARELLVAMFKTDYERNGFIEGTRSKTHQGTIYGKRLLISQALGPKARSVTVNETARIRAANKPSMPIAA